jgi:hypothetical protein
MTSPKDLIPRQSNTAAAFALQVVARADGDWDRLVSGSRSRSVSLLLCRPAGRAAACDEQQHS